MPTNKRLLFVRLATFPGQPDLLLTLKSSEPTLEEVVENVVDLAFPAKDAPEDLSVTIQFEPFDYRGVWIDINSTIELRQVLQAVKSQSVRFSAVIVPGNGAGSVPPAAAAGATNPAAALPFAPVTPPEQSRTTIFNKLTEGPNPTLPEASVNQESMPILQQTSAAVANTEIPTPAGVDAAPHAPVVTASPIMSPDKRGQKRCATSSKKTASKRSKVTLPQGYAGKMSVSQRIIASLAELNAIGINPVPRQHAAIFSGYSHVRSTGFAKAISTLKTKGDIQYPDSKTVALTEQGRASVGSSYTPAQTNEQVQERIKKLMQPKACQIFDLLSDGKAQSRSVVAHNSGYTHERSTGFAKALSTMSSLGIIQYLKDTNFEKNRLVQLTDICFPFGRPGTNLGDTSIGENEEVPMPEGSFGSVPRVSV